MPDEWIERVREADAAAESAFNNFKNAWDVAVTPEDDQYMIAFALASVAAELRAARIARRPGAGQS